MKDHFETKLAMSHGTQSVHFVLHNAAKVLRPQYLEMGGFMSGQVFTLWVVGSLLLLKETHSWALDMDLLEGLSNDDVEIIEIVDIAKGQIYTATLLDFQKNGVPYLHAEYGPQLCLSLSFWKVTSIEVGQE
jgi:hypothetical protein